MYADLIMKETDLAYAAGFLDADGCVSVSKARVTKAGYHTYAVCVIVVQKTLDVPNWFLSMFGGSIKLQMPSKKSQRDGLFCPVYKWSLYSKKAAMFLQAILPYLKTKKARAEAAIQLMALHARRGRNKGCRIGFPVVPKQIPLEEARERERLAIFIRSQNMKTSSRCQPISPMVM